MSILLKLDYFITNFLNGLFPHNIFFDYFFSFFSLKGSSILIWILVIIGVTILEEKKYPGINKRDKEFIILFSSSFLLSILISNFFIKNIFLRPRPSFTGLNRTQIVQQASTCPIDFSFPSTHAATALAAATILTFFDKKRRWFYYSIAVLISYSRIYLGCHYFFDVLAGTFIGWLISRLLLFSPDTLPFRRKK